MAGGLREIFTPLFAYVLHFSRQAEGAGYADLRAAIQRLLGEQEGQLRQRDVAKQDYDEAAFAVVAWVDELVLTAAGEVNRDLFNEWRRSPLQVERFETRNAGEEFFDHLDQLRPNQKEVREIYHLCLCLGFRGRYYDEADDPKLAELRKQTGLRIPVPAPDLVDLGKREEHVTPQPYSVQAVQSKPPAPPNRALWPIIGAVAAACLLYALWPRGEEKPPPPAEPTPARAPARGLAALVEEKLAEFSCHRLRARVDEQQGEVDLEGNVESAKQGERIVEAIRTIEGVTEVGDDFRTVPRPFCEVLDILEPYERRNDDSGFGLRAQTNKGCEVAFGSGERIAAEAEANESLGYIYVDYYEADTKGVAHLVPNREYQSDNHVEDAQFRSIEWAVSPPFGLELVTTIASEDPIFVAGDFEEGTASYVQRLRDELGDAPRRGIVASHCFITTKGR